MIAALDSLTLDSIVLTIRMVLRSSLEQLMIYLATSAIIGSVRHYEV